jgi:hypothetical protein
MKRTRLSLTIWVLLTALLQINAEEPQLTKTWKFKGQGGEVEIVLTRFAQGNHVGPTSLSISSYSGRPQSLAEEAGFLSKVLDELPNYGVELKSLDWISCRFNLPEAVDRVATYAASSARWRGALNTTNPARAYPLVASFMNDSGAFREWESTFRKHGLRLEVASVEKVFFEPFPKTGATCPPRSNCKNLRVPTDALVQLNIHSMTG